MQIIAGTFKNRILLSPKSDKVRPTTSQLRETLFNICQQTIQGAHFLDLFAGSGAMGLEALSRGAIQATFVENHRQALLAIKNNIAALKVEQQTLVIPIDIFKALKQIHKQGNSFELIYADPPYGKGLGALVLAELDKLPILSSEGSLFIEDSSVTPPILNTLRLYKERKIGNRYLYEYRHI